MLHVSKPNRCNLQLGRGGLGGKTLIGQTEEGSHDLKAIRSKEQVGLVRSSLLDDEGGCTKGTGVDGFVGVVDQLLLNLLL